MRIPPATAELAIARIRSSAAKGEVATGLLYVNESQGDLHAAIGTDDRPLYNLPQAELCPGSKALESVNARFR